MQLYSECKEDKLSVKQKDNLIRKKLDLSPEEVAKDKLKEEIKSDKQKKKRAEKLPEIKNVMFDPLAGVE